MQELFFSVVVRFGLLRVCALGWNLYKAKP